MWSCHEAVVKKWNFLLLLECYHSYQEHMSLRFYRPSSHFRMIDYKNDLSLKGEFVRNLSSSDEYSEEEKEELLSLGIKLLNGEDIE